MEAQIRSKNRLTESRLKTIYESVLVYQEVKGIYPNENLDKFPVFEYLHTHYWRTAKFCEFWPIDYREYEKISIGEISTAIRNGVLIDPYNDMPFMYFTNSNDLFIWSLGPDKKDNSSTMLVNGILNDRVIVNSVYNPTNGVYSQGDIIVSTLFKEEEGGHP